MIKEWNNNPEFKKLISINAIQVKDKMKSTLMRSLFSLEVIEFCKSKISDKDWECLYVALVNFKKYFDSFDSKTDDLNTKLKNLKEATDFFTGKLKTFKLSGLTHEALNGLRINLKSFQNLLEKVQSLNLKSKY